MSESDRALSVQIGLAVLTGIVIFAMAMLILLSYRKAFLAREIEATADGRRIIPISRAELRGGGLFGVRTRNSMKPLLEIGPGGVTYRVLSTATRGFAEIAQADVHDGWAGTRIDLRFQDGAVFKANVRDRAMARAVLLALPQSVPLSERARAVRAGG